MLISCSTCSSRDRSWTIWSFYRGMPTVYFVMWCGLTHDVSHCRNKQHTVLMDSIFCLLWYRLSLSSNKKQSIVANNHILLENYYTSSDPPDMHLSDYTALSVTLIPHLSSSTHITRIHLTLVMTFCFHLGSNYHIAFVASVIDIYLPYFKVISPNTILLML